MKSTRKTVRLMTVLMLGATVFSPTKKAFGSASDDRRHSVSKRGPAKQRAVASKQVLAGDTFVNSTLCSAAGIVLKHLNSESVTQKDLESSLQALHGGGIAKVMSRESTYNPNLSKDETLELIKQALEKVSLAQDDPAPIVDNKQTYKSLQPRTLKERKTEIQKRVGNKHEIESLFAEKLTHVMEETPSILNSFLAKLPQTEDEKKAQKSCAAKFAQYFISKDVVKKGFFKSPILPQQTNPRLVVAEYDNQLTQAARLYDKLLQREETLLASKPVAVAETTSEASSSSVASVSLTTGEEFKGRLSQLLSIPPMISAGIESAPSSSTGPELVETVPSPSSSSSIHSAPITYRTTAENPDAINKHSAVSIQLSNEDLQTDAAYELIINHRTRDKGAQVRVFDQKTKKLNILGDLPYSLGFSDESFDITPWVKSMREGDSSVTNIAAFLTFASGKSDIHSFKIQSRGNTIKEMVFGDKESESQSGIHVYGPETNANSNEWSESRIADDQ